MFAVPGWSVSADSLKAETASSSDGASKKRKRAGGPLGDAVTSDNVTQLYESVVKGKKPDAPKKDKSAKRQKKNDLTGNDAQPKDNKGGKRSVKQKQEQQDDGDKAKDTRDQKKKKKKKTGKHEKNAVEDRNDDSSAATDVKDLKTTAISAQLPPAPPKLTPLQAAMREKLVSARFRHLNETLYTKPSEESFSLFQDSPEMFDEYHEGFRRQVKVWPENPVDSFLRDIRSRGKIRQPLKGKPSGTHTSSLISSPLPRTGGTCTIADLGCGDAALAQSLEADKRKMHIDVKSYDLQSPHALVTKADIADLPLEEGSVNVAIFCLALMGTNWIDFIEEAFRVLHWKGELWVAEIKSRFGPVRNKHAPVEHSVGNRKRVGGKKGKGAGGDAADPMDLAVEVDGVEDNRKATDVSAFVDALQKRGFVLNGERSEAIDLSNKMFVKMRFLKGATPTKGRAAKVPEPGRGRKPSFAPKNVDEEDKDVNESAILKPCVYKIR